MKVQLKSDRKVHVRISVKFKDMDLLWQMQTQPSQLRLSGRGYDGYTMAIPGRRPHEIDYFMLRFDEQSVKIYPDIQPDGEMAPIVIYEEGRDYWSHVLRQKALEAQ